MKIKVSGSNMEVGNSLSSYVDENLDKEIKKFFENAISADVVFSKEGAHMVKTTIVIDEGVKGSVKIKSDGIASDAYGSFNEASQKAVNQIRRYKDKIKNYRRNFGGVKSVEPDFKILDAKKYVIPPLNHDVFKEFEESESTQDEIKIISEKSTEIEKLSVSDAIMKMDLANLPALIFINKDNGNINAVYHRKDGNISWIDHSNKK